MGPGWAIREGAELGTGDDTQERQLPVLVPGPTW